MLIIRIIHYINDVVTRDQTMAFIVSLGWLVSGWANLVQVLVLPLADFAVGWEVAALREAAGEGEAKEALQEALFG